jgi:hypothetical protein
LLAALGQKAPLHRVSGIIFRDGARCVVTGPREMIRDLDSLPFPHEAADLLVDGARFAVVRDRQSYEALHAGQRVPEWLME